MLRTRTCDYLMPKPTFGCVSNAGMFNSDSNIPDADEWAEMNTFDDYDVDLKILN